jgi:hypothetical protein
MLETLLLYNCHILKSEFLKGAGLKMSEAMWAGNIKRGVLSCWEVGVIPDGVKDDVGDRVHGTVAVTGFE